MTSAYEPVILAIDDDPINLEIIQEFLSTEPYRLLTANSGEEGLEVLHREAGNVDAVLLDRMMPGIDGIEVLNRIKQDPVLESIPVILLTAAGEPHQIAEGIRAGCFYYLTKPFDFDVLRAVLTSALRDHACRLVMQAGLHKLKDAIRDERSRTHQATMMATYHYLNNALNQFQLVLLELDTKGWVNPEILTEIKASIHKTATEMREFGQMEDPTKENVEKFINDHL